jgi:hypothetical protein
MSYRREFAVILLTPLSVGVVVASRDLFWLGAIGVFLVGYLVGGASPPRGGR